MKYLAFFSSYLATGWIGASRPARYALPLVTVAIGLGLRFVIAPQTAGLQYVTFFPTVTLTALVVGFGPGIFAAALSCVLANYNFFPPVDGFNLSPHALLSGLVFLTEEVVVCGAIAAMRYQFAQKRRIEGKLRESEANLRAMMDNLPHSTWLKDAEGRYLAVNKAYAAAHGLDDPASAIGRTDFDFHPPHLAEKYRADDREVMSSGRRKHVETQTEGGGQWLEEFKTPLSDAEGGVRGTVGFAGNITARKTAENELRIAATAFDGREGIVITDANEVILRVNQAFVESTGYSAEEIVGQTPRVLKSGHHDEAFYIEMWRTIHNAGSWQGEIWDRRKNGEVYPKWLSIKAVKNGDGVITNYVASHTDITERKAAEREIKDLAFYDSLTGLPNRRLLMERLGQALVAEHRRGRSGALLFVDLDHFKTLNDTLGHDKGDVLLKQVAQRLHACIRESDTAARLGGDEFVVLLEDLNSNPDQAAAQAKMVGEKVLGALGKPYLLDGHEHSSTPSIGVTLFGNERYSIADLMKHADIAMYQAKAAGRNALRFFDPALQAALEARAKLEVELRQGIAGGQFCLFYQPQVECGRVIGAEALIRWHHPERGTVSPLEFIPLAEETGLIRPLGQWVLETACQQIAVWAKRADMAHLAVAVNVSAHQLRQPEFVRSVLAALDRAEADPRRLKLELTESMLANDIEDIIAKMNALRSHGVLFSLDDFGTGYSSLSFLRRLPLAQVKIDRSFVTEVLTNPNDAAIARTIIALGQTLGLKVIAEGVETAEQCEFLAQHGCHAYQGYLFSKPLPVDAFEDFLRSQESAPAAPSEEVEVLKRNVRQASLAPRF